ncbi:MAG: hypothetical protein ACOCP4_03105 [Candidatus Woesearchaeota archaeon]
MPNYDIYYRVNIPRHEDDCKYVSFDEVQKEQEYRYLTSINASNLSEVSIKMQGENWSPNGEARDLIQSKGLHHTSLYIGDVVYDSNKEKAYIAKAIGYREIPLKKPKNTVKTLFSNEYLEELKDIVIKAKDAETFSSFLQEIAPKGETYAVEYRNKLADIFRSVYKNLKEEDTQRVFDTSPMSMEKNLDRKLDRYDAQELQGMSVKEKSILVNGSDWAEKYQQMIDVGMLTFQYDFYAQAKNNIEVENMVFPLSVSERLSADLRDMGVTPEDLDECVIETSLRNASRDINKTLTSEENEDDMISKYEDMASSINNEGMESQVEFLLDNGWKEEEMLSKFSYQKSRLEP